MVSDLTGKRILITGASGGLGSAMARLMAAHGARVGLHYFVNKNAAEALKRELGGSAELFCADLRHAGPAKKLIDDFVAHFGGIDVLVNNAGAVFEYAHYAELSEQSLVDTFALNTLAPLYLTGEAFRYMEKQRGGRIINISSVNVKYGGSAKSMHYCAAKAALESMARAFARVGAPHGILVNTIRCGFIDTPMRSRVTGYRAEDAAARVSLIPLKRMGTPLDIAHTALFLASSGADFITGEIITVAGGD